MKKERVLRLWGLIMVGETGPILAGNEDAVIHRTSTELVSFDAEALTGVTASGRPYRLVGKPDPDYALNVFHSLWDASDTHIRVVTPDEAVALIEQKGNRPFERTAEEQAAVDQQKLDHLACSMRNQIIGIGIDTETAARRAGLSIGQLQGLLEADLTRISADKADDALVRLTESDRRFR